MNATLDTRWLEPLDALTAHQGLLLTVFLISLRLGALFMFTPMLQAGAVPPTVRVLFVVGLASVPALGLTTPPAPLRGTHAGLLILAAASEVALGALLAAGVSIAFAAIAMAGRLIDVQIGFGMAQVFDPVTQRQIPVITSAFNQVAVLAFFLADAHHALLRGIAYSLDRFPPGQPWPLTQGVAMLIKQAAGLFSLGFALAAPVMVCLLLIELALGVVARNLPQMNMFVIGIPVKVVLGLVLLAVWFGAMGDSMGRIHAFIFRTWQTAFEAGVR